MFIFNQNQLNKDKKITKNSYREFAESFIKSKNYSDKIDDIEVNIYTLQSRGIL